MNLLIRGLTKSFDAEIQKFMNTCIIKRYPA